MNIAALVLGLVALVGMAVGFTPCLGWYNWFNIPVGIAGVIVGIIARKEGADNTMANSGIAASTIAIVVGLIRLALGGGIV